MYPVDIGGRMKVPGKGMSPLSDVDIISTTNSIYVNESGDSMKGPLDMKNNKIVNLPNPNRNNDASNKFYVDDSIINATKNYSVLIKEMTKLNGDLERLVSATHQLTLDINKKITLELNSLEQSLRGLHDTSTTQVYKVIKKIRDEQTAEDLKHRREFEM